MTTSCGTYKLGYWKGKNIKHMPTNHIRNVISYLDGIHTFDYCHKDLKMMELHFELRLRQLKNGYQSL